MPIALSVPSFPCFHSYAALLLDPRTQLLSAERRQPIELES